MNSERGTANSTCSFEIYDRTDENIESEAYFIIYMRPRTIPIFLFDVSILICLTLTFFLRSNAAALVSPKSSLYLFLCRRHHSRMRLTHTHTNAQAKQ